MAQNGSLQPQTGSSQPGIGLLGLMCIVVSAMVGGGVFNLPQNLAATSSPAAACVAWAITAVGTLFLAQAFRILSLAYPDLKNGIYTYAERGFGRLAGFFVAYGYWVCNIFAMGAYGVLLPSTLGLLFPDLFGGGATWAGVALSSGVTWLMYWLACKGAEESAAVNLVGTACKFVPLVLFVVVMALGFSPDFFGAHRFGAAGAQPLSTPELWSQVSPALQATLFLFVGIEGAVVVSGRARSAATVSRATVLGYLVTLLTYLAVSLLPFGSFSQEQIAGAGTPSLAALMVQRVGAWGAFAVNAGVVVSVLSSWLVWMVMLGQMPLFAAGDRVFPASFGRLNGHGAPQRSLLVTALAIQAILILVPFLGQDAWGVMVSVTAVMAMPCYLACCLFLFKEALGRPEVFGARRRAAVAVGVGGSLFSLLLLAESGMSLLLLACVVYAAGIPLFVRARSQAQRLGVGTGLTPVEWTCSLAVAGLAVVGLVGGLLGLWPLL